MKLLNPASAHPNSTAEYARPHITSLARLVALHPQSRDVILEAANAALQAFGPLRNLIVEGDYLVVRQGEAERDAGRGRGRAHGSRGRAANEIVRVLIQAQGAEGEREHANDGNVGRGVSIHTNSAGEEGKVNFADRKMASKRKAKTVVCSQVKRVERSKPFLHDEVIFTVLSCLPANCLHVIMRYVCNTWAQIIRNPHFVETHLQRSKPGLFIQRIKPGLVLQNEKRPARFLEFKENGDFEITNFNHTYPGIIESSCEGMLVFYAGVKVLYVANPIIMDVVEVPPLGIKGFCNYSIARLPNKRRFKLVYGPVEDRESTSWYVLTLGIDDSWRKLGSLFSASLHRSMQPIPIGQFIYWTPIGVRPSQPCDIVITDIAAESVSKFSFSTEKFWSPQFVKIGNYLSCVQTSDFGCNIYVSKDVKIGGWEIYHKIVADSLYSSVSSSGVKFIACIDQELILMARNAVTSTLQYFAYNMKTQRTRSLDGLIDEDYACLHINSLVSWSSF